MLKQAVVVFEVKLLVDGMKPSLFVFSSKCVEAGRVAGMPLYSSGGYCRKLPSAFRQKQRVAVDYADSKTALKVACLGRRFEGYYL